MKTKSVEERFWAKVQKGKGCWLWIAARFRDTDYGMFWFNGKLAGAHRVAYELTNGPIPDGYEIDHVCHNLDLSCPGGQICPHHRCVRPDHLEAVTGSQNSQRGRRNGFHAAKTHCPRGHEYTEENTKIVQTKTGTGRACRQCARIHSQAWNEKVYRRRRAEGIPARHTRRREAA